MNNGNRTPQGKREDGALAAFRSWAFGYARHRRWLWLAWLLAPTPFARSSVRLSLYLRRMSRRGWE